jgi:hypothetical protein
MTQGRLQKLVQETPWLTTGLTNLLQAVFSIAPSALCFFTHNSFR